MVPPFLKFYLFFYFPGTLLFDVLWYFLDFLGILFLIFHFIFPFVSFYFIHGIYILYVPSAPQEFPNTLLSDTWYLRFDFQISFFFIILHRYFFFSLYLFFISLSFLFWIAKDFLFLAFKLLYHFADNRLLFKKYLMTVLALTMQWISVFVWKA